MVGQTLLQNSTILKERTSQDNKKGASHERGEGKETKRNEEKQTKDKQRLEYIKSNMDI